MDVLETLRARLRDRLAERDAHGQRHAVAERDAHPQRVAVGRRATVGVALFSLVAGLACLTLSSRGWALNPWLMGIPFGAGQFFAAGILYRTLECHDEPEQ